MFKVIDPILGQLRGCFSREASFYWFVITFCLPLQGQLHEGIDELRAGQEFAGKPETLITRMVHLALQKAKQMGYLCYVTLDAYFSTGPAFLIFKEVLNENGEPWVHLITRAKDNYVGYMYREPQKRFEEEKKVHLWEIFDLPHLFEKAELMVYGQLKTIQYCCIDLLWRPINDLIRFVCVMDGDSRYLLMSSDLNLSATQIITIYSYRSKIEVMFLVLKHLLGAFCYRFWTKVFPKLKRGQKLDSAKLSESERQSFGKTIEAIERFVNLAGIALGLLQYLSLTRSSEIWNSYQGWLRTRSCEVPSEGVVQSILQTEFFSYLGKVPVYRTLRLVMSKTRKLLLDLAA